jgi:hypothetical protein
MRVGMRRFTRLTNAFSKKLDNHMAAIALHFMHYNFALLSMTASLDALTERPEPCEQEKHGDRDARCFTR